MVPVRVDPQRVIGVKYSLASVVGTWHMRCGARPAGPAGSVLPVVSRRQHCSMRLRQSADPRRRLLRAQPRGPSHGHPDEGCDKVASLPSISAVESRVAQLRAFHISITWLAAVRLPKFGRPMSEWGSIATESDLSARFRVTPRIGHCQTGPVGGNPSAHLEVRLIARSPQSTRYNVSCTPAR